MIQEFTGSILMHNQQLIGIADFVFVSQAGIRSTMYKIVHGNIDELVC